MTPGVWPPLRSRELQGQSAASLDTAFEIIGLSKAEQDTARSFATPLLRTRYARSRSLLRQMLGGLWGCEPGDIQLRADARGKPWAVAVSGQEIAFNIAHSEDAWLAAFSLTGPVGVDIECVEREVDAEALSAENYSPPEVRAMAALAEPLRTHYFLRCWTCKEAYLKALGVGLHGRLDAMTLLPSGEVHAPPGEPGDSTRAARNARHVVAAVAALPGLTLTLERWN